MNTISSYFNTSANNRASSNSVEEQFNAPISQVMVKIDRNIDLVSLLSTSTTANIFSIYLNCYFRVFSNVM
jgi:hypothetical protein